jgi:polar amino acid transport system permease protein
LVASIVQGGIEAVEKPMRRAARSLGMSYWQDMIYVVWPIGLRAVFPSWVGVALSVIKDSALVSVLGYVELLRASQILMTRTQEPFIILSVVGAIYFAISFPLGLYGQHLEKKWSS